MLWQKRPDWVRLLPFLATAGFVYLAFQGLKLKSLAETFGQMRLGWFAGALALYGLLFLPAAVRWHLVLKLAHKTVSFAATFRDTLIGHFFYTTLFGVVGGDSAKAFLYARRHRFPAEEILATTPLDRFLGLVGSIVFAGVAFLIAAVAGGFTHGRSLSVAWPVGWILLGLAVIALMLVLMRHAGKGSAWARFWSFFVRHSRTLGKSWATLFAGFGCGLLVQVSLSGVLALNLCAVSTGPVPWSQILWTFPLIVAISALPITVGGLGTREGIATILWSTYGVSRADAVAAALLTMAVALFWATAAGVLLWTDTKKQRTNDWRAFWTKDAAPSLDHPKGFESV